MLLTRVVALTAAFSLVSLPAAASPYRLNLHSDGDPSGYAPAGTHEVIVVETPAPPVAPAPPAPPEIVVAPAPIVQPYADPTVPGPTTTTVIVAPRPAPAPAPVIRRPPPPPRRGLGMAITGFSMFGTTYLLTAWAGALIHDGHGTCNLTRHECREMGKALMVPFVGPIMATQQTDSARETFGLFLLSGLQIATFTMGVIGAVRWSRYKRWERNFAGIPVGKNMAVQPMPVLRGAALGLNYRF
jgi:hypothetical protein